MSKKQRNHHGWDPVGFDRDTHLVNISRCRFCGIHRCTHHPTDSARINPAVIVEFSDLEGGVIQTGASPVPPCTDRIDLY